MDNPYRGELGGTASTTLTNTIKKWNKMSERTSIIFGMRDVISTGTVSPTMKRKCIGIKNTSKSSVIWMLPSSHLMPTMPPIPKGLEHS